ncbi:MAG: bacteriohemerythrin [bacterium]|jgi:hemerythrin
MTTLFDWRDEYAYGLPEIDAQHQRLFALGAKARALVPAGADNETAAQVLADILALVREHFRTEQALMSERKCPSLASHQAEHERLLDLLGGFASEFDAGRAALTDELLTMLDGWIRNHLTTADRQMAAELAAG